MLILYLFCLPQGKNGLSTTCTTLNNVGVICFLVNHLYLVIIKFGIFNVGSVSKSVSGQAPSDSSDMQI